MKIIKDKPEKIRDTVEILFHDYGDHSLNNEFGSSLFLSSENKKYSNMMLVCGRLNKKIDFNNDPACIYISENENIDSLLIKQSRNILKEDNTSSFIALNADKIKANTKKYSIDLSSNKYIALSSKENTIIYVGNDLIINTDRNIKIVSKGNIEIESDNNISIKCRNFTVDSNNISLGKNANFASILGEKFKLWIDTHVHPQTGSPPNPAPPYLSRNVKLK